MARLSRKEIKHDEFVDSTWRVIQKVEDNPRPYVLGAAIIVGLLLGGWGLWAFASARSARAMDGLTRGLAALEAPVVDSSQGTQPQPDDPYAPTFAEPNARVQAAVARLSEAAGSSGSRLATYLHGVALLQAGQAEQAVSSLETAHQALGSDPSVGPAVTASYARALELTDPNRAAELWSQLVNSDEKSVIPQDWALAGLGRARALAGDSAGAIEAYRRLTTEFPNSRWTDEATSALAKLGA